MVYHVAILFLSASKEQKSQIKVDMLEEKTPSVSSGHSI